LGETFGGVRVPGKPLEADDLREGGRKGRKEVRNIERGGRDQLRELGV